MESRIRFLRAGVQAWRRGLFLPLFALLALSFFLHAPASAQPAISVSPTSLSFGNVAVDSSAIRVLTISNTGTATLSVGTITSSNPQFVVSPTQLTVAAQAGTVTSSQTVTLTFIPTSEGSQTGTLTIPHNAPGSPSTISLSGTGNVPAISLSSTSLSFGNVKVGSSVSHSLTIFNTGTAALSVRSLSSSNPMFVVSPPSLTVPAFGGVTNSTTISVTFTPTSAGLHSGTMTLLHNATGSPSTISLSGTGVASSTPPSPFPDLQIAGKITFELNSDIYVMNTDGANQTRLTNTRNNYNPSWSPDGAKIAFESIRDGSYEIYVMNADGTGQTRLTDNSKTDRHPSWSPDGAKIAFDRTEDVYGNNDIYVMNADGTNQVRLTNNSLSNGSPSWSPDGTKIAFVSDRDGDFEIYVMNADGTGQTRITNNSVFDQYPSWSPDGTKIALASTHDGNREIYTMSADGTNLARLTVTITGTEESPSWGEAFRRIGLASVGASVSRTMAVENRGGAPLTVSHIASSDPQFTISPTSFTVTPGGSQNVAITFTPTSAGAKYATLTITSNDADAPAIRLIVNGTGRGPAIFLFSSALSFGSVKIGTSSAQTFTMSNTGTEPLSVNSISSGNPLFTASPTSFSLAPGASQRVTVTFAPTGVGSQTGTLSISHGAAESPATVALSGAGTNQTLSLSSTLLFFDSVSVGSSATRMFTVFNTGAGMLSVSSITSSDPQFTVSPASFTVEAQADTVAASQVVTVTFTPASTGQQTGKLTLLHNAAGSPSTISLLGAGVVGQPILSLSSTSLSFGNVAVGSSATRMFTISNTGTVALSVGSITSSNPQFTVSPASFTVAARAGTVASSQTVTVTFTPTGAGPHTGALVIPHNAPGSPDPLNTARSLALVSLSGTGAPSGPAISLSTASLSFGGVNIGSSATRMFTISNSGTAALSVGSIASSNPLFTVSPASFTVAAQASTVASSQTVTVTFTPTGAGSQTGALTIPHNAAGSPSSISLSGVGVDSTAPDLQIAAKIAFTSDNAIYTINANGTGLTRLTSDLASVHENHPSWSPDGAKIAFNGIYVMNADGTNRNRLSNISMFDQEPSWSPGGTKIAFFTDRDGNPEIYAMNADGTGQTNLTNNSAFDLYPSWSPDGTRIAFVSRRDGNDKIYVMNADGTNLTRLTNDQAVDGDPSWSPDGTRIVFTRNYNDIYMMNADGTNLTRLTSGASPSWSPDGTKIAFRSYYDGNADIAVINADGTGQTRLTYHQPGTLGSSYAPSWGEAFRRIGSTAVGTPVSRTMTIENRGRSTLSVTNITSSDAQFTVSPTSFTVPTSGSQNVTITFNPTSAGTKYTTLTITSNDGDAPTVRLIVNGTGAGDFVSRPDRLDFGNVAVGAAVPLPLTLYNRGSDTLRIDSLRVTPPSSAFTVAAPAPNFIIAPGDSQAVSVSFRPSASGDVAASLTASTSDPDHRTLSIPLRGTGVPLTLSVDLNPAEGDQRQTRMYSVRPGAQIPVQVFVDGAPSIKGFSLQIAFDPRTLAFVPGSFVPGPLVPGLIGLANVQKGYVEVGGTTLEGGTGGGSGLLGTLTFSVLQEFDRETRLSIPLVVWNRVTGGRQAIQTDVHVTFTKFSNSIDPPVGGAPAPDFSRDGKVDFDDFFLFAAAFGSSNAQFDLDGDGAVGFSDFFIFAEAFGK